MKLALALALATPASAAIVSEDGGPSTYADLAAKGQLGSKLTFKIDGDYLSHSQLASGSAAQVIGGVIGCGPAKRLFRDAGKHEAAHKAAGLDLWYEVKCSHEEDKVAAAQEAAAKYEDFLKRGGHEGVRFFEPELEAETSFVPNDTNLGLQPHYQAVDMEHAWDIETGDPDVVVQVLDTGLDLSHPDLQNNIWLNAGEICGDGIDNDGNGFVDDCHGYNHADNTGTDLLGPHWHGSHCGGTIAADTNNGAGVAGVAGGDGTPNSGVKLMISVGFGDTSTGGFAEAIAYGADNGAHVSSNSWGYTAPGAYQQSVLDAIDYFNSVVAGRAGEGIVVFAAGNQASSSDYYPGYYSSTVAVAATQNSGVHASFTNYGAHIDISAPGVNVYSTLTGTSYGTASGTSMACPHVAGILALGKSHYPSASKTWLLDCLYSTANDIDPINGAKAGLLGAGLVDAYQFLLCLKDPIGDPQPTAKPTFNDNGPKPTPKPTPGQQTPKPTIGNDKPCCVGLDGKCEFHWWNGDIQTESECLGFHPLCKWICPDDDEPPKPTPKPTKPIEQTPKPTPGDDKPCCVDPTGQCQHLWWNGFLQTEDKCEAYLDAAGNAICKWICDDDEPPPKPTPKPTPYEQTPKPTPGDGKPCCIGGGGKCEHYWWIGDVTTEDECHALSDDCKWICDDDEPPPQTPKPTPSSDDKPCCVDPSGMCQHLWWNGFLQTEDKCEAFNDGLCKWICDDDEPPPKPTPKPTPGDEKPCCVGGQGECQQMWWNGYLQTEDKCEAYHGGDMCKWICNDDEPVTPQPTWSWGDDDDDDDNTWDEKPPLKVKFVDIIRGHKKVGPVGVMTWLAECDPTTVDCDDVDPYIGNYFKIEYRTEKNGPWTVVEDPGPDGARPFFREVDGTFRHVLVEAPCMEKVQVRITGAGFVYGGADDPPLVVYSDAVVSKPKKLKC